MSDSGFTAILSAVHDELTHAPTDGRHGTAIMAGTDSTSWKRSARALPDEVAKLLRTIDLASLRMQALGAIEETLFGWRDRRDHGRALDTATIKSTWRSALAGSPRADTLNTVRHAVDDAKHVAQVQKTPGARVSIGTAGMAAEPTNTRRHRSHSRRGSGHSDVRRPKLS